ncbi:MAG: AraC family transcriptional regulator, partial [Burkholderiaceae bacterium]
MVAPTPFPVDDELHALRAQMVDLTMRHIPGDGSHQSVIPCLHLIRAACTATTMAPALYEPGLVIVLQGRKKVQLGTETLYYDPLHFLLVSMTMLPRGQVIEATPDKPYLCVRISCDTQTLADLMLEVGPSSSDAPPHAQSGLNVAPVSESLLGAALRLLQLLESPLDQRVLSPLLQREIFYRVLTGPLGPRLRALATQDSAARRLSRAIDELTRRFNEPLSIEELAEVAHMSPSTLHQRFKQLTSFSPMQYQKQLRLHEARRLMLVERLDVGSAGYAVGYQSPSQFSREYA